MAIITPSAGDKWQAAAADGYTLVRNENGATLGVGSAPILTEQGLAFKDLNRNGVLDPYEDWRLPVEERARDLAARMSVEQIAGLMLYSQHQAIPAVGMGPTRPATYGGKPFPESGAREWDLSDQQKKFLTEDNVRHVLVTKVASPEVAARWNNGLQALAESIGLGIPANNSSDPRNGIDASKEFNMGAGGNISMWPEEIGLAATFDPDIVKRFGEIASREYRALGIATALSPQIDMATDPRWGRFNGTFGEDPKLATDMARAYCDGFQTTQNEREGAAGWGADSVNAMVKHWPGGGSGEGGRDAHFNFGKYAVYPGGNFEEHMKPFTEGAFKLEGGTGRASAVMPYYTISTGQDPVDHDEVGNSYNRHIIGDRLRGEQGYDGVVCTDWGITGDEGPNVETFSGKCWGVETLTVAQRHYRILMAGVDQFGGNNDMGPVLEAYRIGVAEHGEAWMRARFEQSAVRLLMNIFRVGLFENPYLEIAKTVETVGNAAFMKEGYEAQRKSVVLVKNRNNTLPLRKGTKVYIPERFTPELRGWFGMVIPARTECPLRLEVAGQFLEVVKTPEEAACALVLARGPMNVMSQGGYDAGDAAAGGNGYVPISLQYRPYTAEYARETSLAGGDPLETFTNRTYRGKSVQTLNTRKAMPGKPVVVVLQLERPAVVREFEAAADAIVVHFGVQDQALLDVICGETEPSGLLPLQLPADMKTVEEQDEDRPHDMACHVDTEGHAYDFGFGLSWQGVIRDERVKRYGV
jgi:beta-glucosidase